MFFRQLLVKNLQFEDGKMIPASKYFSSGESSSVELTDEEKKMAAEIKVNNFPRHRLQLKPLWKSCLNSGSAFSFLSGGFSSNPFPWEMVMQDGS